MISYENFPASHLQAIRVCFETQLSTFKKNNIRREVPVWNSGHICKDEVYTAVW